MIRLNCPECGKGINAPQRMVKDDLRRFCIPCSEKVGRLVVRVSPKREARKKQKATARHEKIMKETQPIREAKQLIRRVCSVAFSTRAYREHRTVLAAHYHLVNKGTPQFNAVPVLSFDHDSKAPVYRCNLVQASASNIRFGIDTLATMVLSEQVTCALRGACFSVMIAPHRAPHRWTINAWEVRLEAGIAATITLPSPSLDVDMVRLIDKIAAQYNKSAKRKRWDLPSVDPDVVSGYYLLPQN
jgi:hypothetical protein